MELKTLISEEESKQRIIELGKDIEKDYKDKELNLICILKGSTIFTADLMRAINKNVKLDFIRVSSYDKNKRKELNTMRTIIPEVEGKNIILIEDIVDSGYTMNFLVPKIKEKNPKSVKVCTLLDKPERREIKCQVDYVGFEIGDVFVLGYGLDYDQNYRNLPFVAYVDKDDIKEKPKVIVPKKG